MDGELERGLTNFGSLLQPRIFLAERFNKQHRDHRTTMRSVLTLCKKFSSPVKNDSIARFRDQTVRSRVVKSFKSIRLAVSWPDHSLGYLFLLDPKPPKPIRAAMSLSPASSSLAFLFLSFLFSRRCAFNLSSCEPKISFNSSKPKQCVKNNPIFKIYFWFVSQTREKTSP